MDPLRPTRISRMILEDHLAEGARVIDATSGNGHDTEFLARRVGTGGHVFAFDIQKPAIDATRARLEREHLAERVTLVMASHAGLADHCAAESIDAVVFNLGYLPGEDHATTTVTDETLRGIEAAAVVLKSGGLLSVVCYPGHPGGDAEARAVTERMRTMARGGAWRPARFEPLETLHPAPFLLVARKA